jgi:hypothetical protein
MAVDSAQKRASALNIMCPWRSILPLPDTIDQADRQQVTFMYSGILAGEQASFAGAVSGSWNWDLWRR